MSKSAGGRLVWPLYLVLAYGITWAVQVPAYLYLVPRGIVPTNEGNFRLLLRLGEQSPLTVLAVLGLCFSFGPSIAGIIAMAVWRGGPGLREMFASLARVRIPGRWIAFALLFPIALSLVAVLAGSMVGGFAAPSYGFLVPLSLAVPFLLFLVICTGLAEELGWRGFGLPYLQTSRTAEGASWVLGIAWGLWHVPSVVLLPLMLGAPIPQAISSLVGLTIGIVGYTIVLTWFYNNTRSLFWIVILHGYANAWQSYLVLSSGNFVAQVIYGVLPWLFAVWLLKRFDKETLTKRIPSRSAAHAES